MKFSLEQVQAAMEDMGGFCIACGAESGQVEPDARRYVCEACGERKVYGAEELLVLGLVT
jgi:DNA-directed RNA polymerase subunit RPC12/RpoP